jgi:hypothetical protein
MTGRVAKTALIRVSIDSRETSSSRLAAQLIKCGADITGRSIALLKSHNSSLD